MSGMLSLMYVQSLFQFGANVGKWEGYYGDKYYLDMFFVNQSSVNWRMRIPLLRLHQHDAIPMLTSHDLHCHAWPYSYLFVQKGFDSVLEKVLRRRILWSSVCCYLWRSQKSRCSWYKTANQQDRLTSWLGVGPTFVRSARPGSGLTKPNRD